MTWTSSAWPWRHRVDLTLNQNTGSYSILGVGFLFRYWRCELWLILDRFMMSEVLLWCKDSTIYKGWQYCDNQEQSENYDKCSGASHYSSSVGWSVGFTSKLLVSGTSVYTQIKGRGGTQKYYFWHLERPSQTNGLYFWT